MNSDMVTVRVFDATGQKVGEGLIKPQPAPVREYRNLREQLRADYWVLNDATTLRDLR